MKKGIWRKVLRHPNVVNGFGMTVIVALYLLWQSLAGPEFLNRWIGAACIAAGGAFMLWIYALAFAQIREDALAKKAERVVSDSRDR